MELLDSNDCALVIIDLQEKLLEVMHEKERILENAVRLVKFAGVIELPIVITEQDKLGPTVTEVSDEITNFSPIPKIEFDACKRKDFIDALRGLGRKSVIIAGIESHICIAQTVISLIPDYRVHVIQDAVGSRTEQNKKVAVERMRQAGAVISSTEMVIYELLRQAGTPEFKEGLRLIK